MPEKSRMSKSRPYFPNTIFHILWITLFGFGSWALFTGMRDLVTIGVAYGAGVVCFVLANFADVVKIKGFGVEVERLATRVREIEMILEHLREVAVVLAEVSLSTAQAGSRWGGMPKDNQRRLLSITRELMERLDVPEGRRQQAEGLWHQFVKHDYVLLVLGSDQVPKDVTNEEHSRWKRLGSRFSNPPSPDELEAFLREADYLSPERTEYLEDYRFYLENLDHRRPEVFAERTSKTKGPLVKQSKPDGSQA